MVRKMIYTIGLFVVVSATVKAQEVKQTLTEKIQVTFPAQPVKRDLGPAVTYAVRLADSTANFTAMVTDLEKANNLTADAIAEAMLEPEFWEQVEQGFLMQMGKDAKVVSREPKKIGQSEGREMVLERPNPTGGTSRITAWFFIEGKMSIYVVHNDKAGKADQALKAKYFASVVSQ
ncbi:MAG: hypothetical protein WBP58_01090 [Chitinophagaceae bacterium]